MASALPHWGSGLAKPHVCFLLHELRLVLLKSVYLETASLDVKANRIMIVARRFSSLL